jgi:hypothetical protein
LTSGKINDPDMIIGGNFGLSFYEAKTQLALWSIYAAPLFLAADLRTLHHTDPDVYRLIVNDEMIAIDQVGFSTRTHK